MKRLQCRRLFFAGWMVALAGFAVAEQVDPRFPSERVKPPAEEWTRWPRARIRHLEAERDQLLKRISVLPQHDPNPMSDHLGYHSLFADSGSDASFSAHQIDFKKVGYVFLDSIALAPAFNPMEFEGGAYAFPKRFKIEVQNSVTSELEVVVNWMDEDFPDPGRYPVFFSEINRSPNLIRITIPQGVRESGLSYDALGEIYLFRRMSDGRIGGNMSVWATTKIAVSDSLAMPPVWDVQYLRDGVSGFGFPLSDEIVTAEDLLIISTPESPLSDEVQLTMDLGCMRHIGPIDFWPAAAPEQLALPVFGFPEKISVELSADPDFKTARMIETKNSGRRIYSRDLFSVKCMGYEARYVRITLKGLRKYMGERILGLGEISVYNRDQVWSINSKVTAQGIPEEYLDQLPRLVDGYSRHRRILKQGEWIKGLAQRRPLDRRLVVVERELELARAGWHAIQLRSGILAGSLIGMGLIGGLLFQRRQRRRSLETLKWRIARDLHDDVSSNLGSISLVAERLEQDVEGAEVKGDLSDLSLLAREASVSLREVVWVMGRGTIRLPALIQKLSERAERVLYGMELSIETPADCPNWIVPLALKRHLIMFFKEAVHNCARHSSATQVHISISTEGKQLRVRVSDNGCGFDLSSQRDGWGLDSMQKRAEEMGGTMEINARAGEGTSVELAVPLAALLGEKDHLYKTSN